MQPRYIMEIIRSMSSNILRCSEHQIRKLLMLRFPEANVNVVDVSGGCGAMFDVFVETKEFKGLTLLKQHKLITEILKEQIKDMHGVRIHTSVSKK